MVIGHNILFKER